MSIVDRIIAYAKRRPYSPICIGDDLYMERFWIVPYTSDGTWSDNGCGPAPTWWGRLLQRFGIAMRVHIIHRSDQDREFHDHPWNFLTIILRGGYWEHQPDDSGWVATFWRPAGSILFRHAADWHRLTINPGEQAVTLFITFRKRQMWGFLVNGQKVPWWAHTRAKP